MLKLWNKIRKILNGMQEEWKRQLIASHAQEAHSQDLPDDVHTELVASFWTALSTDGYLPLEDIQKSCINSLDLPTWQYLELELNRCIQELDLSPNASPSATTKLKQRRLDTFTSSTSAHGHTEAATASMTSSLSRDLYERLQQRVTASSTPSANSIISLKMDEGLFTLKSDKIHGEKFIELNLYNLCDVQNVPPQQRWSKATTRMKLVFRENDKMMKRIELLVNDLVAMMEKRPDVTTELRPMKS